MNDLTLQKARAYEAEHGAAISPAERPAYHMTPYAHQVRPGLTGWAQVNGYRGDTSIRKRIECDLYYIENWSIGFDVKIIFLTFFKGFINKNAY